MQQQSMESPAMCRSLTRELIRCDLVKVPLKRLAHFCSRQFDVCDDQCVITAGPDSLFVQVADIRDTDTGRDADAVITAAQVLSSPPTVVRVGKRSVGVVPYPAFQLSWMVGVPQAQDVFGSCTGAKDECLFLCPPAVLLDVGVVHARPVGVHAQYNGAGGGGQPGCQGVEVAGPLLPARAGIGGGVAGEECQGGSRVGGSDGKRTTGGQFVRGWQCRHQHPVVCGCDQTSAAADDDTRRVRQ